MRRMSDNQRKALDALEEAGRALGYAEWRDITGIPRRSFGRVVRAVMASGRVLKEGDGYRLAVVHRNTGTSPTDTILNTYTDGAQSLIDKPYSPDTSHAVRTRIGPTGRPPGAWWTCGGWTES
jgi:hypothetical protein